MKPIYNKIELTKYQKNFIKMNYHKMTNSEMAKELGLKLTTFRMKIYELGYKRMDLEYWTPVQIRFLKLYYKQVGDTELANIFNKHFKKNKSWHKRHIEKKRRYLKLKRTEAQIKAIHQRNVDNGNFLQCAIKRWEKTGQAIEGEIRFWRSNYGRFIPMIKINGSFIPWNRWAWEDAFGEIPENMNVVFKDNNPRNITIENLVLMSNEELGIKNISKASVELSDNYVAGTISTNDIELRNLIKNDKDLINLKRKQLLLKRSILKHETRRNTKGIN